MTETVGLSLSERGQPLRCETCSRALDSIDLPTFQLAKVCSRCHAIREIVPCDATRPFLHPEPQALPSTGPAVPAR